MFLIVGEVVLVLEVISRDLDWPTIMLTKLILFWYFSETPQNFPAESPNAFMRLISGVLFLVVVIWGKILGGWEVT